MTDAKHTPTPWHLGMKRGRIIYGPRDEQVTPYPNVILDDAESRANAAFIVRACNAHNALVAALYVAADRLREYADAEVADSVEDHSNSQALAQARAALALAEKGGE